VRERIAVTLPAGASSQQLRAGASVIGAIAAARWEHLGRSFTRMASEGAQLAPEMGEVLGRLDQQLREAAAEREPVGADRLDGP
jgi:hypothetical protein